MNQELLEQLKSPQARIRHEAMVKLARIKDEEAIPILNDISKNDPEPRLRQLAERSINHILNEFSSTMSRMKVQETPPSKVPPFSNRASEENIQRAYETFEKGSTANALQYLIKALDTTPQLVDDFDVQLLAEDLTGMEGAAAAKMLADPQQRKQFFDTGTPPSTGSSPITPSMIIIFGLFLVIVSQFYLSDGVDFINRAFDEIELQQLKQSVQQVNGANFYVVTPSRNSSTDYPLLVALPDGQENSTAMLRHFSELADTYDAILLVPEFGDYRFAWVEQQTITLQAMIDQVGRDFRLDAQGAVLFGFGDGASIATRYANRYPESTGGVVTSGGTFLYPPAEDVPYTFIYGADDTLLRDRTDTDVPFADLTEWTIPLNYLTIENIGHEINIQQIEITKQVLLTVYQ